MSLNAISLSPYASISLERARLDTSKRDSLESPLRLTRASVAAAAPTEIGHRKLRLTFFAAVDRELEVGKCYECLVEHGAD